MDIKPFLETETIKVVAPEANLKKIDSKIIKDPNGVIPSSIYRVIKWEKIRQNFTLIFMGLLFLSTGIWITLLATIKTSNWSNYLLPVIFSLLFFYKFLVTFIEIRALKKAILRYREDLKYNLTSTPPFLARMYLALYRKQVAHNWITFFIMFYGGTFTLIFWFLKDVNWWVFNFKTWISNVFGDPFLMSVIFSISLFLVAILHIVMTVQRKKKLLEMDSFFGAKLAPQSEIEIIRANYNKMWRRIFFVSVLIILIVPLFVWVIYKIIKRKK